MVKTNSLVQQASFQLGQYSINRIGLGTMRVNPS